MQKFYCDNCGTKVSRNAAKCPHCGRFFKSVRCPSCGLTGPADLFLDGCPSCGYAAEKFREDVDFYELEEGGRRKTVKNKKETRRFFSDKFYLRAIPILFIIIILLVILLLRTGW
ncbi:MAG: zinc ribbon domain-containing protein [Spirochaetales bacterium]|uniref:Zinc ribbon domain-containing protein n=1 Tax=Candidatus Thalassospirochaeta sargassi TaxID=3119039 RepID=A0AAJ1MJ70_9SPIO|nr:zinc ribbon domain-containing protein [Spirochaetales bacterium]